MQNLNFSLKACTLTSKEPKVFQSFKFSKQFKCFNQKHLQRFTAESPSSTKSAQFNNTEVFSAFSMQCHKSLTEITYSYALIIKLIDEFKLQNPTKHEFKEKGIERDVFNFSWMMIYLLAS